MNHNDNSAVEEIVQQFVAGRYEYDTKEYVIAGEDLHNKLTKIESLIPMLLAENKSSQKMASYIAALEADNACAIFPYVFDLLDSQWVEVRDEVCDCFTDCANTGEQLVALIRHLDDPEQRIRLKVITVLACLKDNQLEQLLLYLEKHGEPKRLLPAIPLLTNTKRKSLTIDSVLGDMSRLEKVGQVFLYALAIRDRVDRELIFQISDISSSQDIKQHFQIYFE